MDNVCYLGQCLVITCTHFMPVVYCQAHTVLLEHHVIAYYIHQILDFVVVSVTLFVTFQLQHW